MLNDLDGVNTNRSDENVIGVCEEAHHGLVLRHGIAEMWSAVVTSKRTIRFVGGDDLKF